ncbi:MAG: CHAT domain-containing protein [Saprospiraceae bacterium]|nr:CHAT domain-containing protein [Candidatus Defluviibacterium haderslevense]
MKYFLFILNIFCLSTTSAQQVDSLVIKQVDSLIQVSRDLTAKKDFNKALEVNEAAEKLALDKLGRASAAYGSCAFNRGRVNYFKGNNQEAETWYLQSQSIREKVLGKEHPDFAWCLNNLAVLYWDMGYYEKAEPLYLEAKDIWEKTLGKEHPHYAMIMNNLALFYRRRGNYEKAETFYLEAKNICEKVLGKEHPDYAESLTNLGILYSDMGNYEKAETFYLEANNICKKVLSKEHPIYVWNLESLAILYFDMANYEKAEPLFLESKDIKEKLLGKENPKYALTLHNLANLYTDKGNYGKAEPLYLEAKDIREKTLGKEHPAYANCLNNLASLYFELGNYEKAEPLYLEAKSINEKVLGKEDRTYASNLNNLAVLYKNMGNNEKAESLYLEAKDIREKTLGKKYPDYAMSLNNLASLYFGLGAHEKAEPLYLEAKDIWGKTLGKEHPLYALCLNNLADGYKDIGNYEKAEPLYLEAKNIREKVLGKEHHAYASSLNNLADLYERQTRFLEAELLLLELLTRSQVTMVNATTFLSEAELTKYTHAFQNSGNELIAYIIARHSIEAELGILPNLAYDHALFHKGFLLTAASRLNAPSMTSAETMEINFRLKGYRRRLSAEYTKPIAERKGIAELEEKANASEKELARSDAGYADAIRQVKWKNVQAGLKPSEIVIEFVHCKLDFPKNTDSILYAALILKSGDLQPKFIPLFEEKSLDSLLNSKSERKADYVNSIYTLADRGAVAIEMPKKSLYEILWKPFEKELTNINTIYFSPSGLLHRINLDAIPINETETLADRYKLIELNSTRQLVIPIQMKNVNNDAVLYGGIQYEQDSMFQNNEHMMVTLSRGELSFNNVDTTLRGGSWTYLAGTEREVNAIEIIMQTSGVQTTLKKGYQATEESFKNIGANNSASPKILHIATHGYFFPDPKINKESLSNSEPVFKISDHPMLRSGLIMAGGNVAWQGKQILEGREDGILTAYEISQMNLSNTELVVLSACETGLGEIQGNEGIYGLQRAFKIAGAKYLIMSLWQVPDKQTSLLMTTFYKKWLEEKMNIQDAFHAAQKELRDNGLDPYNWAGFVLVE